MSIGGITPSPSLPDLMARAVAALYPEMTSLAQDDQVAAALALLDEAEREAVLVDGIAKVHVKRIREHFLQLGPTLYYARENKIYLNHPEHFGNFQEWLDQSGIGLSYSKATDCINWWIYAVPQLEAAGIDPSTVAEGIDESKIRLLVPRFRDAAEGKTAMSVAETKTLMEYAANETWLDLKDILKPSGTHQDTSALNPEVSFYVLQSGESYQVKGTFDAETMAWIQARLRPTWLHPTTGDILHLPLTRE